MIWAHPEAFLLILLWLGWVYWLWPRPIRSKAVFGELRGLKFSRLAELQQLPRPLRVRLRLLPQALRLVAGLLVIVALARPQRADTRVERNVEGIDIMLALDVSDSMLIEDMKPENRLEASKLVIRDFIDGRVSDRIGLVVFSGESYTKVPLTLDYGLLKQILAETQTTRNIKMGTAIGVALANAVARLVDSKAKSRVIIFLTDGENNSGTIDPETALDIAKQNQTRIYTIGMGQDGQAQLPVMVPGFNNRLVKQYRPIHSKVNDELLARMANETGGKYFRATTSVDLSKVFKAIDSLERTNIEINSYTEYAELYPPFVEWALALLVMSWWLGFTWLGREVHLA